MKVWSIDKGGEGSLWERCDVGLHTIYLRNFPCFYQKRTKNIKKPDLGLS